MSMEQHCSQTSPTDEVDRRTKELMLRRKMRDIGFKLLVLSGKGGVGKSTIAANLAFALAAAGNQVGLLDVDIHGPSIPKLMGLEGRRPATDEAQLCPVQVSENLKVMSIGFLLDSGSDAVIWRGPLKHNVIRQFLKDVAWGRLDYLVIDSPPGTGDEPLSVAQLVGSPAGAVIVTTPQDLSISDVRRCVSFCNTLSLPVIGIIENMSGLLCPHCGEEINLFKTGGGETLAEEMNVPFLGRIPIDPQIVTTGDSGTPFIERFPDTPAARAFTDVVGNILTGNRSQDQPATANTPKENRNMKIAIPRANGRLSMHFGHCEQFALVEADEVTKKVGETEMLTPPGHEPGVLPAWLHEQGATVIIAGGMGQRAQQLFVQSGITVVVGAPSETPDKIVSAYLDGALQTGDNICDH